MTSVIGKDFLLAGLTVASRRDATEKSKTSMFGDWSVIAKQISPNSFIYSINQKPLSSVESSLLIYLLSLVDENGEAIVEGVKEIISTYRDISKENIGKSHRIHFFQHLFNISMQTFVFSTIELSVADILLEKNGSMKKRTIMNYEIISKGGGRGKKVKIKIKFNKDFLEKVKETSWYRNIDVSIYAKLRRPISKILYLHLLFFRKKEGRWKIYITKDVKSWYKNVANSFMDDKSLTNEQIIKRRIIPVLEEISEKTELQCKIEKSNMENYIIYVEDKGITQKNDEEYNKDKEKEEKERKVITSKPIVKKDIKEGIQKRINKNKKLGSDKKTSLKEKLKDTLLNNATTPKEKMDFKAIIECISTIKKGNGKIKIILKESEEHKEAGMFFLNRYRDKIFQIIGCDFDVLPT